MAARRAWYFITERLMTFETEGRKVARPAVVLRRHIAAGEPDSCSSDYSSWSVTGTGNSRAAVLLRQPRNVRLHLRRCVLPHGLGALRTLDTLGTLCLHRLCALRSLGLLHNSLAALGG